MINSLDLSDGIGLIDSRLERGVPINCAGCIRQRLVTMSYEVQRKATRTTYLEKDNILRAEVGILAFARHCERSTSGRMNAAHRRVKHRKRRNNANLS